MSAWCSLSSPHFHAAMSAPKRAVTSATPCSKAVATIASRPLVGSAPKRLSGAHRKSMARLVLMIPSGTDARAAAGIDASRTAVNRRRENSS